MFRYAARNAILPSVVGFALDMGFVVSGALLVERVFSYPGIGYVLFQAVGAEDYPLMQAIFLVTTSPRSPPTSGRISCSARRPPYTPGERGVNAR